mgnify:CR=1 FL=1
MEAPMAAGRLGRMRLLFFLLLTAAAFAQMANRPPAPMWLASEKAATITREVRHEGKLLKAVLLTAADAPVEVMIDGKAVASLAPMYDPKSARMRA